MVSDIRNYEDLIVWQKAMQLINDIYRITRTFPNEEMFGLCSQMRRAAVSIASNIAEGSARGSRNEFAQFISIARGSLAELQTQIRVAYTQLFIEEENYNQLMLQTVEISRMLMKLFQSLKAN